MIILNDCHGHWIRSTILSRCNLWWTLSIKVSRKPIILPITGVSTLSLTMHDIHNQITGYPVNADRSLPWLTSIVTVMNSMGWSTMGHGCRYGRAATEVLFVARNTGAFTLSRSGATMAGWWIITFGIYDGLLRIYKEGILVYKLWIKNQPT